MGYQTNNHTMMGSTKDPKDGGAVAAVVFGAVAVYAVRASNPSPSVDTIF
jgi:hypothetical protein